MKRVGLLLPVYGGSRAAALELQAGLQAPDRTVAVFDYYRLCQRAEALLKNPAPDLAVDFASQVATLHLIAEKTDAVIVPALAPLTRYFLQALKNAGVKTLYWAVEDFRLVEEWAQIATAYSAVACIQKGEFEEKLKGLGCARVRHIPHGTARAFVPGAAKIHPVSFVGAPYPNRVQVFQELLRRGVPLKIWGDEWKPFRDDPVLGPALMETGRWMNGDEVFSIYQQSHIVLNLHSASTGEPLLKLDGDFLNPRVFDAAASGALQLVDRRPLLAEAFTEGKEVECFASVDECAQKIEYFLAHPDEAAARGRAAAERCAREHTIRQREEQMLELLES